MSERRVVDASPLIVLAHADALRLLEQLPSELVVPEAVVEEILAAPTTRLGEQCGRGGAPDGR